MKLITFCKEGRSFLGALGFLLIALLLVIDCALFKIKPVVSAEPGYSRILWVYRALAILLIVLAGILAYILFVKGKNTGKVSIKLSVTIVAVLGMVYIFVMPPLSAPDEIRHYLAAYKLSNQMMFSEQVSEGRYVYMRAEDAELLLHDFPGRDDYYKLFELKNWLGKADTETVLYTTEKAQVSFALAYLPQSLAITIGRLIGLRQLPLMMLARVFTLATFLIFFYLALRLMPFGKEILLAIACLPMVLEEVTAITYDAVLLALAFYFIAYVLHLTFMADKVRVKDTVILTAVMSVLAPIKMIYIMLVFLMFMIPKAKFGSIRTYIISALSMAGVVALVFLSSRASVMGEYVSGTNTALSYAEQGSYTLSYLLSHPLNTVKIFLNSLSYWPGILIMDMVGARMGWQDVLLSDFLVVAFIIMLFVAAIKPAEEPVYLNARQKAGFWILFVIVTLMIGLSMLVGITPLGELYIWGIQGRYFLPILPLSMLAVRNACIRREVNTNAVIMYGMVLLNIWAISEMIGTIVERLGVMKMLPAS